MRAGVMNFLFNPAENKEQIQANQVYNLMLAALIGGHEVLPDLYQAQYARYLHKAMKTLRAGMGKLDA